MVAAAVVGMQVAVAVAVVVLAAQRRREAAAHPPPLSQVALGAMAVRAMEAQVVPLA